MKSELMLSAVLLSMPLLAQDEQMAPSEHLQKLAPLVGNWHGAGKMIEPGVETPWSADATYRWCLDGHFVQEDFRIRFEGQPGPLVFRSYLGWDREAAGFVEVIVASTGEAELHPMELQPDGAMVKLMKRHRNGATFVERASVRVTGDVMAMTIDFLMNEGPSVTMITGSLQRGGDAFDGDFAAAAWMGAKPGEAMQRLGRMEGDYVTEGQMVMAPGQPPSKIGGTDGYWPAFGGTVMRGHTVGHAEGMPGEYHSDQFWAFDEHARCVRCVYVDNMGSVGQMELRFATDGSLVSTSAGTMFGEPMVQRFIVHFDAEGRPTLGVGDTILGTAPPFEGFRATYRRK